VLSNLQQTTVWEGWLASEIRACYFADLGYRYQRRQRVATWIILASSSGALATLLSDWLPLELRWIRPVLAALTAGVSLWSLVSQNDKAAIDCADLHFCWNKLAGEYRALWDDMHAPNARKRLEGLFERSAELSKSGVRMPNKEALMNKWQDHVVRHHVPEIAA
jgi:hypothetical protein